MNFINQALEKNLPLIQRMDNETIDWIIKNEPKLEEAVLDSKLLLFIKENVKRYSPLEGWFSNKEGINTIHGIRHIMRVIANMAQITWSRKTPLETMRNSFIAATLHDIRRQNDKGDKGHAARAVEWFVKNLKIVMEKFGADLSPTDVDEISTAISLHEIPYAEIYFNNDHLRYKEVTDLLKTADALDRYRLPKLRWWIKDEFLELIPTDEEKMFAYHLVVDSERKYIELKDSVNSVFGALERIEL